MELIDKSVELIVAGDTGRQCKQGEAGPSTVFVMFVRAHSDGYMYLYCFLYFGQTCNADNNQGRCEGLARKALTYQAE